MVCQDICAKLLLPRLCTGESVYIDVGAHIGSVLADVRRIHPSIRAVAIEADPEKAAALAKRFPDVEIHSCALGESEEDVTFFIDAKRPGFSSLAQANRANDDVQSITVPMRRLDDVLSEQVDVAVAVIKMDVEGAELGVLRGATDFIARARPIILFESGPSGGATMGYPAEDLFDWFAERRYEIVVPNRLAHDGPPLGREGFLEGHFYPFRTLNYFAAPSERRIEMRNRARTALGITASN